MLVRGGFALSRNLDQNNPCEKAIDPDLKISFPDLLSILSRSLRRTNSSFVEKTTCESEGRWMVGV